MSGLHLNMDNVNTDVKPWQIEATIDPGFVELHEYMALLWAAQEYRNKHPNLRRVLENQHRLGVHLIPEDKRNPL